jgi:hypothetical protein
VDVDETIIVLQSIVQEKQGKRKEKNPKSEASENFASLAFGGITRCYSQKPQSSKP